MKSIVLLVFAGFLGSAPSRADEIPVVGLDKFHKETRVALSTEDYIRRMSSVLSSVNASTLPALRSRQTEVRWMLRDVIVGIGVSLTAGLGPIYSVTAEPRIRLIYSNSTHPKFLD